MSESVGNTFSESSVIHEQKESKTQKCKCSFDSSLCQAHSQCLISISGSGSGRSWYSGKMLTDSTTLFLSSPHAVFAQLSLICFLHYLQLKPGRGYFASHCLAAYPTVCGGWCWMCGSRWICNEACSQES